MVDGFGRMAGHCSAVKVCERSIETWQSRRVSRASARTAPWVLMSMDGHALIMCGCCVTGYESHCHETGWAVRGMVYVSWVSLNDVKVGCPR